MTLDELKLHRLEGQHLLSPSDTQTVVKDLCGVQAQFLSYALHGLSIRCGEVRTDRLVKSWTNRGTMHLFAEEDLPLFLHEGRSHFLRPVDTLESDAYIGAERKGCFAKLILEAVGNGVDEREALKALCQQAGMTDSEEQSLFDPWGGIIRALCENGSLCHKVQEKKAYILCPPFQPMKEEPARLELARRFFAHFGPATIKDCAYFFGTNQKTVKSWLAQLPVEETAVEGKTFFHIGGETPSEEMPGVLFLTGFDQLMLGYEKTESLFLPREHLREIFTLAGIVRAPVLLDGTVAGWWTLKNRVLKVRLFTPADQNRISRAAEAVWNDLKRIAYT